MAFPVAGDVNIANQALGRIGAEQITTFADDSVQAEQALLHYEQTRDALLRSFFWRFASARVELTENSSEPDFGWEKQYDLPDDFARLIGVFEDNSTPLNLTLQSFQIEGDLILINDDECRIYYVKKEADPTKFDSLFIETFVLTLAMKLVMPLAMSPALRTELSRELGSVMARVRTVDRQETNTVGRLDRRAWIDGRRTLSSRDASRVGG